MFNILETEFTVKYTLSLQIFFLGGWAYISFFFLYLLIFPLFIFLPLFTLKMATTEELQTLVLTTLDRNNVITDSKDLVLNDKPVEQLALLGALNSLKSKEVLVILVLFLFFY